MGHKTLIRELVEKADAWVLFSIVYVCLTTVHFPWQQVSKKYSTCPVAILLSHASGLLISTAASLCTFWTKISRFVDDDWDEPIESSRNNNQLDTMVKWYPCLYLDCRHWSSQFCSHRHQCSTLGYDGLHSSIPRNLGLSWYVLNTLVANCFRNSP